MLIIDADIAGRRVPRAEVLQWEGHRISAVAHKLGVQAHGIDVAGRREALLQAKVALGPDSLGARLHREVRVADRLARLQARFSARRRVSATTLHVRGGDAGTFVTAFEHWTATSDERAMLRACPDHYVIRTLDDGPQEVIETTGGSPLPAAFRIDYDDVSSLVTAAD